MLSIVVPLLDEVENVDLLHAAIVAETPSLPQPFEIVFVDDGSTDGTFEALERIVARDPRVVAIRLTRNFGQTPAMCAGIEAARGQRIVTMDGDLQNDPADIPMLLARLDRGFDIVVGRRVSRQDHALTRKLPSRVANWLIGQVTGMPISDNGCSLKAFRAETLRRMPLYSDMHRFMPAMSIPFGARVSEMDVRHHARRFGASKYGLRRIFKVVIDLITIKTLLLFAQRPLRRFSVGAAISAAAATGFLAAAALREPASHEVTMSVTLSAGLLFGWLAANLFLLGLLASLIHWRRGVRSAGAAAAVTR